MDLKKLKKQKHYKIEKNNLLISAAIFAIGFSACTSTPTEAEQDAISLNVIKYPTCINTWPLLEML